MIKLLLLLCLFQDLEKQISDALDEMKRPGIKEPIKEGSKEYVGTHSITLKPDEGRLIVIIKTSAAPTPTDALRNENSTLNVMIANLKKLDTYEIKMLKHITNDDYKEIEIYGGVTLRTVHRVKNGYASYTTLDIHMKPEGLQKALELLNNHKHKIVASGYGSTKEATELIESRKLAIKSVFNKLAEFDNIGKINNFSEEVTGESLVPALGISIYLTTKVKVTCEVRTKD